MWPNEEQLKHRIWPSEGIVSEQTFLTEVVATNGRETLGLLVARRAIVEHLFSYRGSKLLRSERDFAAYKIDRLAEVSERPSMMNSMRSTSSMSAFAAIFYID